jgi:hypothetical protein
LSDKDADTFVQRKVVTVQVPDEHAKLTVSDRLLLTPVTCGQRRYKLNHFEGIPNAHVKVHIHLVADREI